MKFILVNPPEKTNERPEFDGRFESFDLSSKHFGQLQYLLDGFPVDDVGEGKTRALNTYKIVLGLSGLDESKVGVEKNKSIPDETTWDTDPTHLERFHPTYDGKIVIFLDGAEYWQIDVRAE